MSALWTVLGNLLVMVPILVLASLHLRGRRAVLALLVATSPLVIPPALPTREALALPGVARNGATGAMRIGPAEMMAMAERGKRAPSGVNREWLQLAKRSATARLAPEQPRTAQPSTYGRYAADPKMAQDGAARAGILLAKEWGKRHADPGPLRGRARLAILGETAEEGRSFLPAVSAEMLLRAAIQAAPAAATVNVRVRVESGNVRSGPSINMPVIGEIHAGDELVLLGVSHDWYLVRIASRTTEYSTIHGGQGWISSILIDEPERRPPTVVQATSYYAWSESSNSRFIYELDGALHLTIANEQATQPIKALLKAEQGSPPIQELGFSISLEWAQGHGPGGSIFHAELADGQDLGMHVGPGEGSPWLDFSIDGELQPGRGSSFPFRTPTPVQVVWTGKEVTLSVGGDVRLRLPSDQPLRSFSFAIDANAGCIFHIKVVGMTVTYAQ